MKLKLFNFRCYEEKEFDFGDKGLVLLSGVSGRGKSTVLMAIDFALFNNGGAKVLMFGKKSCRVELEIQDLKIIRKKGPNHLIVNDVYEDAAGETIIQEKFGKIFNSVSYIPQNLKKSFVLMSPTERLEFLETFAFENFDIVTLKERAKLAIREAHDTLMKNAGELEFAKKMLDGKSEPNKLPFPSQGVVHDQEKYISQARIQLKNSQLLLKRAEKDKAELQANLVQKRLHLQKLEEVNFRKKEWKAMRENAERELENLQQHGIYTEKDVQALTAQLQNILQHKEYFRLKNDCDKIATHIKEYMDQEDFEKREKMASLKTTLWSFPQREEMIEEREVWAILIKKKKELSTLREMLVPLLAEFEDVDEQQLEQDIILLEKKLQAVFMEKTNLQCPECHTKLRLVQDTLVVTNSQTQYTVEEEMLLKTTLEKQKKHLHAFAVYKINVQKNKKILEKIAILEKEIAELQVENEEYTLQECEDNFQRVCESINEYECLDKEYMLLEARSYSSTILQLQKQLTIDQSRLQRMEHNLENAPEQHADESSIRQTLSAAKEFLQKQTFLLQKISEYEEKEKIDFSLPEIDHRDFEHEICNIEETIIKPHQNRVKKWTAFFEHLDLYNQSKKEWNEYNALKSNILVLQDKEIAHRKTYSAACAFRDHILQAESIALSNLISKVNAHVQMYLDFFFLEQPIHIRLVSFKEKKAESKPCINLEIEYRGMDHDLTMLSGGELSRVILSFTLAFAELYNSPLLLLDECTASLDQDLTSAVIEGLRENFGDKLIILIAHQVVKGVFDKVIEL